MRTCPLGSCHVTGPLSTQATLGLSLSLLLPPAALPSAASAVVDVLPPAAEVTALTGEERNTIELFRSNTASVVFVTSLLAAPDEYTLDESQVPKVRGGGAASTCSAPLRR